MKIEIPIRWAETVKDPDALEEIKTRRIITGDDELSMPENTKYTYDLLVCDVADIYIFHRYDEGHTILRMTNDEIFCAGIPYQSFKQLYIEMSGQMITEIKPMEDTGEDDIKIIDLL